MEHGAFIFHDSSSFFTIQLTMVSQNGPDAMGLNDTNGVLVDAFAYGSGGTVGGLTIDVAISFNVVYVEGTALTATADSSTESYVSVGRNPDGQDTNNNNVDFVLQCSTPGNDSNF